MSQLDKIYTADEAADRLRLKRRGVIKLARTYGLCARFGRDYLFSESDLLALWAAIREPANLPTPAMSQISSHDQLRASLQKLTAKKERKRK